MGDSNSINGDYMTRGPDLRVSMVRSNKETAQYIIILER